MSEKNTQITYEQTLVQAGLTPDQATIYGFLLGNGAQPAGKIALKTPIKRGLVYKILEQLQEIGLVTKKDEPGKVAVFEPGHPLKLQELAEQKEKQAKIAQTALSGVLGDLTSTYNLVSGRPGVRFFEGEQGIRQVLEDSLMAKGVIYSYADIESIEKYIKDINEKYVASRERLKIKKKAILLDTPFSRNYLAGYHREVTDIRLIKADAPPFQTVMQVYDGKVSYITLAKERMIGVIVEDPHIYEMHKYLFEFTWQLATPIDAVIKKTSA